MSRGELKRHLNTVTLTFYGVGVIIGAGIYVLVGKLAGISGNAVWLSFVASAVAALPTGLSYAELASRYPYSAGEAVFANRAFKNNAFSFLVGFLILASGVASTAALSRGFTNYFSQFVNLPPWTIVVLFLALVTWLNHRGIKEATWVNVLCTSVSVAALLLIIALAIPMWGQVDYLSTELASGKSASFGGVIFSGAALAFYAYIGFEDICNVAEEVKVPQRTIPRALLASIIISTLLYIGVGLSVVAVIPPAQLAASEVPLAEVFQVLLPGTSSLWLSGIALFAVFNSALLNMIMASRILYGMGRAKWVPTIFGRVNEKRQTPTLGVITVGLLALVFALTGFLKVLAESTNVIILSAFFLVNLSLLVIRLKKVESDDVTVPHFQVPLFVPVLGMLVTVAMVIQFSGGAYLRALGLVAVGVVLYGLHRFSTARDRIAP